MKVNIVPPKPAQDEVVITLSREEAEDIMLWINGPQGGMPIRTRDAKHALWTTLRQAGVLMANRREAHEA